ncbi:MAG: transcription elongation factor GreA [Coriobacteriia bacterium]|nr:transcription elongation factor GreA [Coriobacteriia bacterium]
MSSDEIILTREGKAKLEAELKYLIEEKREEVSKRIQTAREFGDLSENSEYDDAKNEQAHVETRIAEIQSMLTNATVVRKPSKSSKKVNIGSQVKVKMGKRESEFIIVGGAESDVANGKISHTAPVGAALIDHEKGEIVETLGPTGKKIKIEILDVKN